MAARIWHYHDSWEFVKVVTGGPGAVDCHDGVGPGFSMGSPGDYSADALAELREAAIRQALETGDTARYNKAISLLQRAINHQRVWQHEFAVVLRAGLIAHSESQPALSSSSKTRRTVFFVLPH